MTWYGAETVAVVTGANKGIGYEIVKALSSNGITTILTARDESRGQSAVLKLRDELPEGSKVEFHVLEVSNEKSVKSFGEFIKEKFGGFNILVNNAGIAIQAEDASSARQTVDTNYYGTQRVTAGLLPFAKRCSHGIRIVNVASQMGQLSSIPEPSLRNRFEEAANAAEIDLLVEKYVDDVANGKCQSEGWPTVYHSYRVSKTAQLAYTRVLAKELQGGINGTPFFVNAICPGYCATDLSSHKGHRTARQGADGAVWVALRPVADSNSGKFFFDKKIISF